MSEHAVLNNGEELATVQTNPFSISLTEAGRQVSVLAEYRNVGDMLEMEAESPEDGQLALEEEWVTATDETILDRLAQVASLNDWNVVEKTGTPTDA